MVFQKTADIVLKGKINNNQGAGHRAQFFSFPRSPRGPRSNFSSYSYKIAHID